MAGKRLYITIPKRDYELIRTWGLTRAACPGMVCRSWVLETLYHILREDGSLQDVDAELARREREELLHGRVR